MKRQCEITEVNESNTWSKAIVCLWGSILWSDLRVFVQNFKLNCSALAEVFGFCHYYVLSYFD